MSAEALAFVEVLRRANLRSDSTADAFTALSATLRYIRVVVRRLLKGSIHTA